MILGVDPGERRVGVAIADPATGFAWPMEVIDAHDTDVSDRLAQIVIEEDIEKVVVGRPVGLSGRAGPAVDRQQALVVELTRSLGVPVEEFDERLTTSVADQGLRAAGGSRRRQDRLRDAVAAQLMLQGYLDSRR